MTVLHSTRGEDGKATTSAEGAGMDTTTEQVGLRGCGPQGVLSLLLEQTSLRDQIIVASFVF